MVEVLELAETRMGLRRLELAVAIFDAEVRPGQEIAIDQFEDLHDDYAADWHVLQTDLRWMGEESWISFEASAAGVQGVHLLGLGQQAAQRFKDARSDRVARAKALRIDYLRWLYDCDLDNGLVHSNDQFRETSYGSYLGTEYSNSEISKAVEWLLDARMASGQRMLSGNFAGVEITFEGKNLIENPAGAGTTKTPSVSHVTNYNLQGSHGNAFAVNSQNVTQSTAVTLEQVAEAKRFVESAKALIPLLGLDASKKEELAEIVDEVEAESNSGAPKKNVLVQLLTKSRDLAVLGTASGMVTAFEGIAKTALAAIGG